MSQATTWSVPVVSPASPTTMATRMDESLDALLSSHKGGSRPAYAVAGTTWIDDTGTPWIVYTYTGAVDIAIGEINATTEEYIPYIGKLASDLDLNGFGFIGGSEALTFSKTMTDASGNNDYTGFGFQPSAIVVFATVDAQEYINFMGVLQTGFVGGIRRYNPAGGPFLSTNANIGADNTNYQIISTVLMIPDGVRISWTKVGSPTGTLSITMLGIA